MNLIFSSIGFVRFVCLCLLSAKITADVYQHAWLVFSSKQNFILNYFPHSNKDVPGARDIAQLVECLCCMSKVLLHSISSTVHTQKMH